MPVRDIKTRGEAMLGYSIIMFLTAVLFAVVSISIYRGNTNLIHDYHQEKVTDHKAYGKAFGKALSPIAIGSLISGIVPLFSESDTASMISVAMLIAGIVFALVLIVAVQKKYNGGLF